MHNHSEKVAVVWALIKKSNEKKCWRSRGRKSTRSNPFVLGSTINNGERERWQLQTSCRLQRFEQTNRENQLAAASNKQRSWLSRWKLLLFRCHFDIGIILNGAGWRVAEQESFVITIRIHKWKRLAMALVPTSEIFKFFWNWSWRESPEALVYLDDIIIFGRSPEEHLNRPELVLGRIKGAGLKTKSS